MSKVHVFSVRDMVSATFGLPFYSANKAAGIRSLQAEVNDNVRRSVLNTNPEDFRLYFLGMFDDEDATMELLAIPELVCEVSTLVKAPGAVSAS